MANHVYGFYYVYTIPPLVYHILRNIVFNSVQLFIKYNKMRNTNFNKEVAYFCNTFENIISCGGGIKCAPNYS